MKLKLPYMMYIQVKQLSKQEQM